MADAASEAGLAGSTGSDGWEAPPRRPATSDAAPMLSVDGFEGPLDWLLEQVQTRKIDLGQLSIGALIDAFADALTAALARPDAGSARLARWGDWLVMAADLALLRSRLLLPADGNEARTAQRDAEALRRQLLDRAAIVAAADWLDHHEQLGRDVFGRERPGRADVVRSGRVGDITGLLRACLVALRLPDDADALYRLPAPPFWTVAQAMARIQNMLPGLGEEGGELGVFLPNVPEDAPDRAVRCRMAVAGTFAATLEAAREGTLTLNQNRPDRCIRVRAVEHSSGERSNLGT